MTPSDRPRKLVVAALVVDGGDRVLLTRRRADQPMPLLWELPGGKIEAGEAPGEALVREVREELGVDVAVGAIADVVFHRYPAFDLLMLVYRCAIVRGEPRPLEVDRLEWVARDALSAFEVLPADVPLVRRLAARTL